MNNATHPSSPWLKVIPLGGLGHIGGNMMAYETDDDLIVVDCGVLFATSDEPGVDYIVPDVAYIKKRLHKLRGIVLTHGHEDHIGALPMVLPQLGKTHLWATPFTAALVRQKMSEHPDVKLTMTVVEDRQRFNMGGMVVETYAVTHSIPHAVALSIETPIGIVLHTGDFKLDESPTDGRTTDIKGLQALGQKGVALMCSDSTNSQKPGRTWSECEVLDAIIDVIQRAPARVFVTTFASHIDRIQAVLHAANKAGRRVIAVGRSMRQNIALAQQMGMLKINRRLLAEPKDFEHIPRDELVVLASGSQGEARSGMTRIARGQFAPFEVEEGDQVVFSSRRIPGNERAIGAVMNALVRQGATLIADHDARVHSSGHAFVEEQRDMIRWLQPEMFIPLHGEYRHMMAHAALAEHEGVKKQNVFVIEDGYPLLLERRGQGLCAERLDRVEAGLEFVEGKTLMHVAEMVFRDRKILGESGLAVGIIVIDSQGERIMGPEVVCRGLVHVDANYELVQRAVKEVEDALEQSDQSSHKAYNEAIKDGLRRFFKRELGKRPIVVPLVLTLPDEFE